MLFRPATRILRSAADDAGSGRFDPTRMEAEPGMLIGGRYQLISPIASGGMAQVWRGQDTSLVRQVAIKILHPHLATDEAFVARFRREAVASARLSHPSIVAVYDTLSHDGIEAIVMELIEGRTLRAVLDEAGYLPPGDVVDVGIQISDALDEAHRAGIVHRDIKPANIMVGADRRIMVTDFGIAKANADADLTHTGTLLGTAKYLAPEQVAGEPVDPRADIYALGIVLFEAATGEPPFKAETDAATALARLQNDVPRCRLRRATVPVGLDEVIARSMARYPNHRWDRASSFRSALAAVDLTNVRMDTSDLTQGFAIGPAANPAPAQPSLQPPGQPVPPPATVAPVGPAGQPMAPGGPPAYPAPPPSQPVPVVPPGNGTAVLATPQNTGLTDGPKPSRRQRRAAKKGKQPPANRPGKPGKRAKPVRPKRQRPTRYLAAGLIIGGFVVAGLLAASLGGTDGTSSGDGAGPVPINADPFDPMGDGRERASIAPLAFDGDPDSPWQSETYERPKLSGLKEGVGLVITFDGSASVDDVFLQTGNEGWDAEFYVADDFGPNDRSFEIETLGEPLATVSDGGFEATVSLGGAEGSKLLLWITETGRHSDEDETDVYRFVLYEISFS